MVGDGGLAQSDRLGLVADAGLVLGGGCDHREQLDPDWVTQRREHPRERLRRLVADDAAGQGEQQATSSAG